MSKQRVISPDDLQSPEYLRVPHIARPTALGLWVHTDAAGRTELIPEVLAGRLYPGEAATEMVVNHLLQLDEAGFLTIYQADGREWIALTRPLRADRRGTTVMSPPPPSSGPETPHMGSRDITRDPMALGRAGAREGERAGVRVRESARERARAEVRAEQAARAEAWAAVESDREAMPDRPERPMLLDAPPIGCPDHPEGKRGPCGPCRDARHKRDVWLQEQIYGQKLAAYHEQAARHVTFDEPAGEWANDDGWDPDAAF
ncbi:hypothetical protein [Microbacterium karelineae]|uniref:hypothetical protein n=1 Tax=Microbacterium karelineae TaxID=2654283 RepID=UPI0018D32272|nr:hypothetical protein [Microbacterium karelineae]